MSSGNDFIDRAGNVTGLGGILDAIRWDGAGLATVVSQDEASLEVLGVAFANRQAVVKSLETGLMHYYSRSRGKLWLKGEESGHFQKLRELRIDCDGDAILALVRQVKGNCHLGFRSCFSYKVSKSRDGDFSVKVVGQKVFDPAQVYRKKK